MNNIATIFWDVGGVLLTNGWDTNARRRASDKFHLDWDDFQERHELISTKFEEGKLTLDEYLKCAIFHEKREFSRDTFREFMFNQSQPIEHALELLK